MIIIQYIDENQKNKMLVLNKILVKNMEPSIKKC